MVINMIENKKLSLKNDIIFKEFFTRKGNEKFLKSFLEAVLKVKIEEIEAVRWIYTFTKTSGRQISKIGYTGKNK